MTTLTIHRRVAPLLFTIMAIVLAIGAEQVSLAQNLNVASAKPIDTTVNSFYRVDQVQSIYVHVAEEDMRRMLAALPKRIYVRASFRWRGISVENVAIRFKGNSSSAPSQQHKRSFLIKFDEYAHDQRFLGLRRVALDNGVQFGSVFSEPIITETLHDLNIKTHRCNYAKLFLNDKYYGIYVNVERIDQSFIENHLPDAKGLLFKVDEGGPGANLQFLGDDPSAYERTFEPETKSAKRGQHRLVEFIKGINQSPEKGFAAYLDSKMELNDFLRTTAVLLLSGAFDQLTGWQPHNYYLYHDGKRDSWRYLPWDLDVGFCETAFGQIHVLDDWNAAWPVVGEIPNPLLERIVADPVLRQRYRAMARIILDRYFEPERLCAILDARYELIKADLLADPFPHRRITNPGDQNYDDIVASMKQFIRKRYITARQQLENPGKRPEIVRRPHAPQPPIVEKLQRIQRTAERMQRSGKDVSPIQKLMQQIGPLLQKGRQEEAEKLVDEALKLSGDESRESKGEERRDNLIPIVVTGKVEPTLVKQGSPVPLVITIANGLNGVLYYSAYSLAPSSWNGETAHIVLENVYRDGKPARLTPQHPKIEVPNGFTKSEAHPIKPGESITVTTDIRKWKIPGGWVPGKYKATIRVENLTLEGDRCILSVRGVQFLFEIR